MKIYFLGWKAEYERAMIDSLSRSFHVSKVRVPVLIRRVFKLVRSLRKRVRRPLSVDWLGRWVNNCLGIQEGDILICNEGELLHGLNEAIVKTCRGRKVLLVRDLVDRDFIGEAGVLFDKIYSFDPDQCRALGIEHLEQFFPFDVKAAGVMAKTLGPDRQDGRRCFFLGRDKGRSGVIVTIADALRENGCELNFYIVQDKSTEKPSSYHMRQAFSYEESLRKTLGSDILVEVNQPGQTGFTLRVLEVLFFDKKLITTNALVKKAPFYDPARFFIWGVDPVEALPVFLSGVPAPVDTATLERHSPDVMLRQVIQDVS